METAKTPPAVSNVGSWAMNVVSSVGIIMANKQLMSSSGYAFSFATTLTGFHFAVTALVGFVSNAAGLSHPKHVPLWELLWFSVVANLSITGMNLSLMLNSISKLSMIPVVCVMEWILRSKHYSREVKVAVMVVAVGVGVCTVTDVNSIGSLQKKYSVGSFELLSETAPIQALSLVSFGPLIDFYLTGESILKYQFSAGAVVFILLSCVLAVFCNVSQYLCIGRFSAVSFQVLGHMKTVCVLTLGWLLFDSELTAKNVLGMALAVAGMVAYSWVVEAEKAAAAKAKFLSKTSLSEEDFQLLNGPAPEVASATDVEMSGETQDRN